MASAEDGRILLVGGGIASAAAAKELRAQGFSGPITLATREFVAPYHRPPITKDLLRSDDEPELDVWDTSWWADNDIELRTKASVLSFDPVNKTAKLADKSEISFDKALFATGAMVRRLPVDGAALPGIHYLRTPANAVKLRGELAQAEHVVVVGGSFIAVEVAASLAARGIACTMLMQESACLERTFGLAPAPLVVNLLTKHGVDVRGGVQVAGFVGEGHVEGVALADGEVVPADVVIVGVGAVPDTKLAAKSGLELGVTGGIACDSRLQTSVPGIYAAGDVCEYDSVVHGGSVRVEHESHAEAQGITAARNMLGADVPHLEVPYFWTDIGPWITLESVGPAHNWDDQLVTGSIEDADFTIWYLQQNRLVAALTAGRPADLDVAREIISDADQPAEAAERIRARVPA